MQWVEGAKWGVTVSTHVDSGRGHFEESGGNRIGWGSKFDLGGRKHSVSKRKELAVAGACRRFARVGCGEVGTSFGKLGSFRGFFG